MASSPHIPVWQQDPFEHLELVERALALALAVRRSPAGESFPIVEWPTDQAALDLERERAQVSLGLAFEALRSHLSRNAQGLQEIDAHYMEPPGPKAGFHVFWVFSPDRWGGSVRHREARMDLIDRLIELRSRILRKLWVFRDEPRSGLESAEPDFLDALGLRSKSPPWSKLSDLHRSILRELSSERLQRAALIVAVKSSEGAVKRALGELGKHGYIENIPGGGYQVILAPIGAPAEIQVTP